MVNVVNNPKASSHSLLNFNTNNVLKYDVS